MSALLNGPKSDLIIAADAISAMETATSFQKLNRHWQDFLFRIERAWQAAERDLRKQPGFQQWFSPYAQQRKKDPLLVYLAQARNAEAHSVCPTLDRPIRLFFRDKHGYPFQLRKVSSSVDEDGKLTVNIETAAEDSLLSYEARLLPSEPSLQRICNRGKWYKPPRMHLKSQLRSAHPVDAAKLGLAFYSAFVEEADFRFRL
jgi:hypothetical protein